MKRSSVKKSFVAVIAFAFLLSVSSCNRGTGCPNNFSVKPLISLVKAVF